MSTRQSPGQNLKTCLQRTYERWEGAIQIGVLVVFPLWLAVFGYRFTKSIEENKIRHDYVRIATGILSQKVEPGDVRQRAIREWSVEILKKYSPVELTEEQARDLIEGAARTVPLSDFGYTFDTYDPGYTYDRYIRDDTSTKTNAME